MTEPTIRPSRTLVSIALAAGPPDGEGYVWRTGLPKADGILKRTRATHPAAPYVSIYQDGDTLLATPGGKGGRWPFTADDPVPTIYTPDPAFQLRTAPLPVKPRTKPSEIIEAEQTGRWFVMPGKARTNGTYYARKFPTYEFRRTDGTLYARNTEPDPDALPLSGLTYEDPAPRRPDSIPYIQATDPAVAIVSLTTPVRHIPSPYRDAAARSYLCIGRVEAPIPLEDLQRAAEAEPDRPRGTPAERLRAWIMHGGPDAISYPPGVTAPLFPDRYFPLHQILSDLGVDSSTGAA